VAADLMAAQRSGSPADFFQAISRHADVPWIATYALGRYRSELPTADRPKFYRGVAAFMARYFADQSQSYRIARAEIGRVTEDEAGEVLVASTVTLASGSAYNVTWRLATNRARYKVRDVTVLGFSLSHLQRVLFHAYMARRGGLEALVAALTR
jgi:ABC-type transporter MlaC component